MIARCRDPFAGSKTQRSQIEAREYVGKFIELFECGRYQRLHSSAITSRIVVKSRRQLDQPLQKELFIRRRS